jgi:single-strand DNA-binding protein
MNSCILMAEIMTEPELRYTSENQTPIAEMQVQIAGLRPEDPPSMLKVIGWGNLAQEIQANYHSGDRVVIEGRLGMNTIERPEGFKEKRAELTAQRVHRLVGSESELVSTAPPVTAPPVPSTAGNTPARSKTSAAPRAKSAAAKFSAPPEPIAEPSLDEIPF